MKRPLLFILGLLAIIVLVGIWVYVLLNGTTTPEQTDQFGSFEFGDTTDPNFVPPSAQEDQPTVVVSSNNSLRQLTTEPVAGFSEIQYNASTTPQLQYMSVGTGHIFTINLDTGEETRVSGTTIPQTKNAVMTPDGLYVMIEAGEGQSREFIIGAIATSSSELRNFQLPEENLPSSFTATLDNEFLYVVPDGNNSLAKAYNPHTNSVRVLFTVPFRELSVDWHHTANGPHYVYPKTTNKLPGQVYAYKNGKRTRVPVNGFGVSAAGSSQQIIISKIGENSSLETVAVSNLSKEALTIPLTILPEKCTFDHNSPNNAWCGVTLADFNRDSDLPDAWYRGELVMKDSLWNVAADSTVSTLVMDISTEIGQNIDLTNPTFNSNSDRFYFTNKLDQTVWLFDLNI